MSPPLNVRMWLDLFRYGYLYLKYSLHAGLVWGVVDDVASNDIRLQNLYPKEWAELQAIRIKYNAPSKTTTDEQI